MKKLLLIDRDGTLIREAPPTYQVDNFDKLEFYPDMFPWLRKLAEDLDYEWVMISNQDGLGTDAYPESKFWPIQDFVIRTLQNEGIHFKEILIDRSFPSEGSPNRKPATGMLHAYLNNPEYDLPGSLVIGDRITDVQLAANLGCRAIWLNNEPGLGADELTADIESFQGVIALKTGSWKKIYEYLRLGSRRVELERNTNETRIRIGIDLDGSGKTDIKTGLSFFDHMLEQLGRHSGMDLSIHTEGDLHIDEHHTIEDTAIALGEALAKALGDKRGLDRYGFSLPMDDAYAEVAIDLGGRSWLIWDARFEREKIGDMPTEMFYHFFKSFSDAARCNLHIRVSGENEHHKIESIFKALARALKQALTRNPL